MTVVEHPLVAPPASTWSPGLESRAGRRQASREARQHCHHLIEMNSLVSVNKAWLGEVRKPEEVKIPSYLHLLNHFKKVCGLERGK